MKTAAYLISLSASLGCLALLSACDKTTVPLPTPSLDSPTPAVPVLPTVCGEHTDPAPTTTDGTRKPAQTSETQPLPGQNNDHSAPLSPAR